MIETLPKWVDVLFIFTTILTIVFFYYSNGKPFKITAIIVLWSIVHSLLSYQGFYLNTEAVPPRYGLVLLPLFVLFAYSLLPSIRKRVIEKRDLKVSTFLHSIRFPIEIILFQLFIYKMIPELMTFEGKNFDIIMGITAPIIGILFLKNWLSEKGLLLWNVIGLFLISFILISGIFSAELPIQLFGFDQPNLAVTYFPFVLLPATVVPIVLWTHLTDIIKIVGLLKE